MDESQEHAADTWGVDKPLSWCFQTDEPRAQLDPVRFHSYSRPSSEEFEGQLEPLFQKETTYCQSFDINDLTASFRFLAPKKLSQVKKMKATWKVQTDIKKF